MTTNIKKYIAWCLPIVLSCMIMFATTLVRSQLFTDAVMYPKWVATNIILFIIIAIKIKCKNSFHLSVFEFVAVFWAGIHCIEIIVLNLNSVQNAELIEYHDFDNIAGYVCYFCLTLPLGLGNFQNKNKIIRALFIICKLLVVYTIILCESRVGVICIFVFLQLLLCRLFKVTFHKLAIYIVLSTLFIIACLSVMTKTDSSKGRLFIAQQTLELVKEKPIFGYGYGSFRKDYMLKQANYFKNHKKSEFALLADNIHHPISDIILILFDYGFVGLFLFAIAVIATMRRLFQVQDIKDISLFILLLILMLFSYPLHYPFTWIVILYIINKAWPRKTKRIIGNKYGKISSFLYMMWIMFSAATNIYWHSAQNYFDKGYANKAIERYNHLYFIKHKDYQFLYDYSFVLYSIGLKQKALDIAKECSKYLCDYNLSLLKGYISRDVGCYKIAIENFEEAHFMCPSKIVPIYELYLTFRKTNEGEKRKEMAKKIKEYSSKVKSSEVDRVVSEFQILEKTSEKFHY